MRGGPLALPTGRSGAGKIPAMLDHPFSPVADRAPAGPIRGREHERDELVDALDAAARGATSAVLIDGAAGAGRSRLLQESTVLARRLGLRVLELADPRAAAPALDSLGADAPVAVLVDDAHRLGREPVAALAQAHRRLVQAPVAWVLSVRWPQADPALRALTRDLGGSAAHALRLEALDAAAVEAIARDRVGGVPGPALRRLIERADGNPRLLVELLDGAAREGRLRHDGDVVDLVAGDAPEAVAAFVRERLSELPADAAQVVRVAAALGPSCTATQIGVMLDRAPVQLLEPIERAIEADLLAERGARLGFRHELLREGLLRALPGAVRRGLRRQAADVLLASGLRDADVAEQLADGAEPGDQAVAERVLGAAAELAPADAVRAAALAVRAVEIFPAGSRERPVIVTRAIDLLREADRHADAEELGLRTLERPLSAADEAAVRLALSTLDEQPGRLDRAQHNVRALRHCAPAPRARARHLAWLAYNLARAGRTPDAPDEGVAALARAAGGDAPAQVVAALAQVAAAAEHGELAASLRALDALPRLGATTEEVECARRVALARAATLGALGRVDEASQLVREGLASALRNNQTWSANRWLGTSALLDLAAGRLAAAEHHAANTDEPAARAVRVAIARHRGDLAVLRELERARAATRQASGWPDALAAATLHGPLEAARALRDVVTTRPLDPAWYVDAARVAEAATDAELGARLRAATARWADDGQSALLETIARHVRALVTREPEELERAVALARSGERPLVLAAALEDRGRLRGPAGVPDLQAACALYVEAGADGDARRVTDALKAIGMRGAHRLRQPKGWEALTDAELRVVRVVGAGASNREAAERLFLSPHTVSSHLRHAFAKLEINSRVELARMLLQRDGRSG